MNPSERIKLQPCWVLHRRDFRDSSQIVDVISRDHGRVAMVARGVKRPKSRHRGLLQPFSPLLISWVAGRELATMSDVEQGGSALQLGQDALMCGFYANELLLKMTHRFDPQPEVFELYTAVIDRLSGTEQVAIALREFEWQFLNQIGFGLNLLYEVESGQEIEDTASYHLIVDQGPVLTDATEWSGAVYAGHCLRAIANNDWRDPATLVAARRILGAAIDLQLDGKPLHSRRILREMYRRQADPRE
ncbi:MAG: DNA repair protein RecO [Woeseiaceae bacterium]